VKYQIVHVIHSLTLGGAARTMTATAKYSSMKGPYQHHLVILDHRHSDPSAKEFVSREGITIIPETEMLSALESADLVQVNWWQHPEMDEFLRSSLPPMRLLGWFHCACDKAPQVLTDELVALFDRVIGGSSYTYQAPSIWRLPTEERIRKTGYVIGGADFSRLREVGSLPHDGFRIGYVGTVNPVKMYNRFVELHEGLKIPGAKVVVCGGDHHLILADRAEKLNLGALFDFRGYVEDIEKVLRSCDVYGYPLCEDTYAASELNLQEAMFLGLPAVVFPHGGLKTLVINEYNGLVVNSEREYRSALEYLFHNPAERKRLGENAAHFARRMLGAELNAPKLNRFYEELLREPKRNRKWTGYSAPGQPGKSVLGYERFLESLGEFSGLFDAILHAKELTEIIEAEVRLLHLSPLMTYAGVCNYRSAFPEDWRLNLWSGLALYGNDEGHKGAPLIIEAVKLGVTPFPERAFGYLACIAESYDDSELRESCLAELPPGFPYQEVRELFANSLATRPSKRPL
jgi:glycosyltransferase involved in cell wall biosynthesis